MAERGPTSIGRSAGGARFSFGLGRLAGRRPAAYGALAALTLAGALSASPSVYADERAARALAVFNEGREAMKRGDLDEACPKFAESQQIYPSPGTLFNLAVCEQRKGEEARAWAHFREVVESLPPDDDRLPLARSWVEALGKRLSRLTLRLGPDAPAGSRVWLDGVALDATKFGVAFVVDPGAHAVVVQAPDRIERRYHVDAEPGQSISLSVTPSSTPTPDAIARLPIVEVPAATSASIGAPRPRPAPPMSGEQRAGYTLLAIGGSAIAIGALSGFFAIELAREADDNCPNETCTPNGRRLRDTARTFTLASALTAGGGLAVGAVGGVILWQNAPRPNVSGFTPIVTRQGGGLSWQVAF
jgi:tetratricopeptide (TPR) repeat protein